MLGSGHSPSVAQAEGMNNRIKNGGGLTALELLVVYWSLIS